MRRTCTLTKVGTVLNFLIFGSLLCLPTRSHITPCLCQFHSNNTFCLFAFFVFRQRCLPSRCFNSGVCCTKYARSLASSVQRIICLVCKPNFKLFLNLRSHSFLMTQMMETRLPWHGLDAH